MGWERTVTACGAEAVAKADDIFNAWKFDGDGTVRK